MKPLLILIAGPYRSGTGDDLRRVHEQEVLQTLVIRLRESLEPAAPSRPADGPRQVVFN